MTKQQIRSLIETVFEKHQYDLGIGLDIYKEKDVIDDLVEILASHFELDEPK